MNQTTVAAKPDKEKELEQINSRMIAIANSIQIKNAIDYQRAQDINKDLKAKMDGVNKFFDEDIATAWKLHKSLCDKKKKFLTPLESTYRALTAKTIAWNNEQDRLRKEQEVLRQAEAKKRDEDRQLQEALSLEEAGDHEAAAAVIEEPPARLAIVLAPAVQKVEGITLVPVWRYRITDVNKIPLKYLTAKLVENHEKNKPDSRRTAIRKVVEALGNDHGIDGIEAYEDKIQRTSAEAEGDED